MTDGSSVLADASNVLLLAPPFRNGADIACDRLLDSPGEDPSRAVFIACRHSPQQRLAVCGEYTDSEIRDRVVVDVDMLSRSAAEVDGGPPTPVRIETVDDPTDLVTIETTIEGVLADALQESDQVLCFHSLTDLMQHCETRSVFNFLEGLTNDIAEADVFAHYHLDPTAHDPETIRTIEQLFDATLDIREL